MSDHDAPDAPTSPGAAGADDTLRTRPLTADEITETAFRIAEDGGLGTLTMRRLAEELGVSAMALYTHVANKDEILDEIIDRVLAREALSVPPEDTEWKAWTIEAAERLRRVLTRYPALLDRYCRRPVGVPAALRRMEATLEVLRRAGFDPRARVAAYATIHTYTLGFAALEIARQGTRSDPAVVSEPLTESSRNYWPAYFANLPASEFPNLSELTPDLAEFTTDGQFHRGLLSVLDGLEAERSDSGRAPVASDRILEQR